MENSKNVIVGVVFVIVVVGALFLWGRQTPREVAATPGSTQASMFEVAKSSFDFGSISMRAGKVKHSFSIKNGSSTPVRITKLYTSCMCTTAELITAKERVGPFGMPGHGFGGSEVNVMVAPQEEATVEAVFDPAAHGPAGVGSIERAVYVETENGVPVELRFTAQVTP